MKLALDPSMYRDDLTLEEMVYKTAELGYEYIELSPREDFCPFYKYPKVDSAKIKHLKRLLKDTGVKLSSLLPLYHWTGPDEDRVWPGKGAIDLDAHLSALRDIGFNDVVSVELFRPEYYKLTAEETIKTAKETTEAVVLKYFMKEA
ncbi:sugar phosphate isomerase/epimerase [Bacillus siamensis]|nr:sugar phosphate isomerase/epimerase [Bacillus siamensis]